MGTACSLFEACHRRDCRVPVLLGVSIVVSNRAAHQLMIIVSTRIITCCTNETSGHDYHKHGYSTREYWKCGSWGDNGSRLRMRIMGVVGFLEGAWAADEAIWQTWNDCC